MIALTNKQRTVKLLDRSGNVVRETIIEGWDTPIDEAMNEFAGSEADMITADDGDGEFEYSSNSVIHSLAYREDTCDVTYNGNHVATFVVESTADVTP